MDRLERVDSPIDSMISLLGGWQSGIWTAMPAIVVAFDPVTVTCTAQIAIQARVQAPDGTYSWQQITPLVFCPVQLPSGDNCVLTMPIKPGDEVLIIFASRCIDGWWQSGGVAPQAEIRMHDLSDGFAIPGIRNRKRTIPNYSTTQTELRSVDGATAVSLNPNTGAITLKGVTVNIQATNAANVTAPTIALNGALTNNGINIGGTHRHGGVATGSGISGGPQ